LDITFPSAVVTPPDYLIPCSLSKKIKPVFTQFHDTDIFDGGFNFEIYVGSLGGSVQHASLVATLKSVDVMISALGSTQLAEQTRIIAPIKEAGDIKVTSVHQWRFLLVYAA
jgi:hypothetical protein